MTPSPSGAPPRRTPLWSAQMKSVGWQALGSAATLAASLWVSWRLGLAAQGEFGLVKSWFDAAAVVATLGLPQGALHAQYRLRVDPRALRRWLTPLMLGLALGALGGAGVAWSADHRLAAAVLLSLPFAVGHLVARSLLLAQRGVKVFGAVTALPSLLVLMGVLAWVGMGHRSGFEWPLVVAALFSGVVSVWLACRIAGGGLADRATTAPAWQAEVWRTSMQSWVQAALGAAFAAALLSTVASAGLTAADLGAASLGLHLYQVFAVLAGYAAPLMFDRLARQDRPQLAAWPAGLRWLVAGLLLLALCAAAAGWLWPAWGPWLWPASLMLPAGLAAIGARVAGTLLLARGAYTLLSVQAALRLLLGVALTALALRWLPAAAAVGLALLGVELLTWWHTVRVVRVGEVYPEREARR